MALVTDKSLFLHIPKTGGQFVRQAFKSCGIKYTEIAGEHDHFPYLLKFKDKQFWQNKFIFAFVRHPLSWYQSRWAFRVKYGWKVQHELDFNCFSNNFETFCRNSAKYRPNGWVSWEYKIYIEQCPKPCDFVGKTENLINDTIMAFRLAGEKFSEKTIRNIGIINDSSMDGKSSSYWAKYTPNLESLMASVESDAISKYY